MSRQLAVDHSALSAPSTLAGGGSWPDVLLTAGRILMRCSAIDSPLDLFQFRTSPLIALTARRISLRVGFSFPVII